MKRRRIFLVIGVSAVLLLVAVLVLPVIGNERAWIRTAKKELDSLQQPPSPLPPQMGTNEWASGPWLVFSNGWAGFACEDSHDRLRQQNLALMRTSGGDYYLSHYHFCVGTLEFAQQRQPKDIEDFLRTYEKQQGWKHVQGN